jgi:hypothetical protein
VRVAGNVALFGAVGLCLTMSAGSPVASAHASDRIGHSTAVAADPNYAPLAPRVAREIRSVSPATFTSVGSGKRRGGKNVPPSLAKGGKLATHGKPELAYILAEFCPFCAGESWSVAVALSRFGTFHGLTTLVSRAQYEPARMRSIQTISFRYSHFRSRYLTYVPIVNEDVNMKPVQSVPPKVLRAWIRYDDDAFAYPFVDFGGKAVITGSSFAPSLLAKLTRKQIAADLDRPTWRVAKAIDGTANQMTAAICLMTNEKPRKVCDSKTISTIRHSLRPFHAQQAPPIVR